jgi:hypothetical protein
MSHSHSGWARCASELFWTKYTSKKCFFLADNRVYDVLPVVSNFARQANLANIKKGTLRNGLSVTAMKSEKYLCGGL